MSGQGTSSSANAAGSVPMRPTFIGFVATTADAIVLFEASLSGVLSHVSRRPHDRERPDLIKSGYVYIYEEHSSGIKRWTDGIPWSPSRILNNFLVYRELNLPFPPGTKKRAAKRDKKPSTASLTDAESESVISGNVSTPDRGPGRRAEVERSVYGSLIDSYDFKENGLVKKTISIQYRGVTHHLVSYYTAEDVSSGKLRQPSADPRLISVVPRPELLLHQNFRSPVEMSQMNHLATQQMHYWAFSNSQLPTQMSSPWARSMSTPVVPSYNSGPFPVHTSEDPRVSWGLSYGQVPPQQGQEMQQVYDQNYQHGLPQDFSTVLPLTHNPYAMAETNGLGVVDHHNQGYGAPANDEQTHDQSLVTFNSINWSERPSYQNGAN